MPLKPSSTSTRTLVDIARSVNDKRTKGILEDIITINPFYSMLPFYGYAGQAILSNTGTYRATTLFGDVELCGTLNTDQNAELGVSSKAKSLGRIFTSGIAQGTGKCPQMNSLPSMIVPEQVINRGKGHNLILEDLDELKSMVISKDEQLDFYQMASRTIRSFKVLMRTFGEDIDEQVVTLPDGRKALGYKNVPVFKNSYMSVNETANGRELSGGNMASIWAGCVDDGDCKTGVTAIYPQTAEGGVVIRELGKFKNSDRVIRVTQYTNLANFNHRALARLPSVLN